MTEARSAYHSRVLLLLRALREHARRHDLLHTADLCWRHTGAAREAWAGEVFPRAGLLRAR